MRGLSRPEKMAARRILEAVCGRRHQRLSILIYHRVLPGRDPLRPGEPDVAHFRWQMELLAGVFNVLPLSEAISRLESGTLPARAAAITFDDGYADNFTLALPVLREFRLPATVFVTTGFLNGGRMFNDTVIESVRRLEGDTVDLGAIEIEDFNGIWPLRDAAERRALVRHLLPIFKYADPEYRGRMAARLETLLDARLSNDLMMTDEQVIELHRVGIEIGAHTVTHPILRNVSAGQAREEMEESKRHLEALLDSPVSMFAYPNGRWGDDYDGFHVDLARAVGFRAAVSTDRGSAGPATDLYRLPRFTPWDRTPGRFLARMGLNAVGKVG